MEWTLILVALYYIGLHHSFVELAIDVDFPAAISLLIWSSILIICRHDDGQHQSEGTASA